MKKVRRSLRQRLGQRGAVAVEFAFAMFFLIPLLLAMLDFGYYFWVGVNAAQAASAGLQAATHQTPALAVGCGNAAANTVAAAAATAKVTSQMTLGLPAGFAAYTSTPVNGCDSTNAAINPSWHLQVQVDFPPVVGFVNAWMPRNGSPPPAAGMVRYRTGILVGVP